MINCTHRWPQSGHFPSKLGHFFPIFEKRQGRTPPFPTFSYAPEKTIVIQKFDDAEILIDTDDKLPDDITLKNIVILITFTVEDNRKFYPQQKKDCIMNKEDIYMQFKIIVKKILVSEKELSDINFERLEKVSIYIISIQW